MVMGWNQLSALESLLRSPDSPFGLLCDYAVDGSVLVSVSVSVVSVVTVDLLSNWFYKYFALIWKPQR